MNAAPEPWSATKAAAYLVAPHEHSHKYSRGVLGVRTGSSAYPGAAVLSTEAAWRTGVGLVRFYPTREDRPENHGLPTPAAAVLAQRPETVFSGDASPNSCDAWLLGSGTDPRSRSTAEHEAIMQILDGTHPAVVDAGALGTLLERRPKAPVAITPHLGEFRALWQAAELGASEGVLGTPEETQELATRLGATVLLKGSHTLIADPTGSRLTAGPATPWLATAGTGDVLAGVFGALTAVHAKLVRKDPAHLARIGATAALLHDTAARIASGDASASGEGQPITAADVAQALPRAFSQIRELGLGVADG